MPANPGDNAIEIAKLATALANHAMALNKHETMDAQRFTLLSGEVASLKASVDKLNLRIAWVMGAGFVVVTVTQITVSLIHLFR